MSDEDTWTVDEAITNLRNAMRESGQTAEEVFASIDANSDGEINGPELYKGLIEHLGDHLSPGQISLIINPMSSSASSPSAAIAGSLNASLVTGSTPD